MEVNAEVWLADVAPEAIRVQLYAEAAGATIEAAIIDLEPCHALPGSVNGIAFKGETPRNRPANDYSVRIVPHHPDAFIPIEQHCILWNR